MNLIGFFKNPTPRSLLLFIAIASAGILAVALISQYGFGLYPCDLCIYQRYPYAIIAILGMATWFFAPSRNILIALIWLAVALLFVDAAIAAYHAGVESGVFKGPSGCTNTDTGDMTLEEMRAAIMNAPLVSCDQAMIEVLGLSMAAWNAITAMLLVLFSLWGLCKIRKTA